MSDLLHSLDTVPPRHPSGGRTLPDGSPCLCDDCQWVRRYAKQAEDVIAYINRVINDAGLGAEVTAREVVETIRVDTREAERCTRCHQMMEQFRD